MNLPAPAESLCLAYMATEQAAGGSNEQLFLYVGLTNGVCQRVSYVGCLELCPPSSPFCVSLDAIDT